MSDWERSAIAHYEDALEGRLSDLTGFQGRTDLREGDRVRYVPGHANGDPNHPDCEDLNI